jgi:hypothetical protein
VAIKELLQEHASHWKELIRETAATQTKVYETENSLIDKIKERY